MSKIVSFNLHGFDRMVVFRNYIVCHEAQNYLLVLVSLVNLQISEC